MRLLGRSSLVGSMLLYWHSQRVTYKARILRLSSVAADIGDQKPRSRRRDQIIWTSKPHVLFPDNEGIAPVTPPDPGEDLNRIRRRPIPDALYAEGQSAPRGSVMDQPRSLRTP